VTRGAAGGLRGGGGVIEALNRSVVDRSKDISTGQEIIIFLGGGTSSKDNTSGLTIYNVKR